MPIFQLSASVTVSALTEVEADTLEEAIEIAKGREAAIGGNGTGVYPNENWVIEDADGSPENIHLA